MNREFLFGFVRQEICGTKLSAEIKKGIDSDTLKALYIISKKFDIAPIFARSVINSGICLEADAEAVLNNELMLSAYRYENMEHELEAISKVLDDENIPYIPLKGAVIRGLYSEGWMRTSCDIDVLIMEEDIERATKVLCEKLSYTTDGKAWYHDVSLYSESGVHLELHFNIKENKDELDRLLSRAWEFAEVKSGYQYAFTNEFLIFYSIAHMAYHFLHGGCGIRPFIDLYLMESRLPYDAEGLSGLCRESEIEEFRNSIEKLVRVWLLGDAHDELTRDIEDYIFSGEIYGDIEVANIVAQEKSGGKLRYFANRIIQPYELISKRYPILKKYPCLTPYYQAKRWFDVLAEGKAKKARGELLDIVNSDSQKKKQIMDIINKVGLKP